MHASFINAIIIMTVFNSMVFRFRVTFCSSFIISIVIFFIIYLKTYVVVTEVALTGNVQSENDAIRSKWKTHVYIVRRCVMWEMKYRTKTCWTWNSIECTWKNKTNYSILIVTKKTRHVVLLFTFNACNQSRRLNP